MPLAVGKQLLHDGLLRRIAPTLRVQEHRGAESEQQQHDDNDDDLESDVAALAVLLREASRPLLKLLVAGIEEPILALGDAIGTLLSIWVGIVVRILGASVGS